MRIPISRPGSSRLRWLILFISFAWSMAFAVEPFTVADIRVEGLQRSDAGTVFASLPFRVGDTYNDEKGAAALRALFATVNGGRGRGRGAGGGGVWGGRW